MLHISQLRNVKLTGNPTGMEDDEDACGVMSDGDGGVMSVGIPPGDGVDVTPGGKEKAGGVKVEPLTKVPTDGVVKVIGVPLESVDVRVAIEVIKEGVTKIGTIVVNNNPLLSVDVLVDESVTTEGKPMLGADIGGEFGEGPEGVTKIGTIDVKISPLLSVELTVDNDVTTTGSSVLEVKTGAGLAVGVIKTGTMDVKTSPLLSVELRVEDDVITEGASVLGTEIGAELEEGIATKDVPTDVKRIPSGPVPVLVNCTTEEVTSTKGISVEAIEDETDGVKLPWTTEPNGDP